MLNDVVIANKSYIKLEVQASQTIDPIALEVMKQDCPDFLLPIKTMERDEDTEMRYELSSGIRLKYINQKMVKKDFIALMIGMLTPYKICNDWFLDYHNLYLDAQNIFVDRDYQSVKYVYVPVEEYRQEDSAVISFFEDFIVKTELSDDPGYTMNLFRILKGSNANLVTLLNYIQQGGAGMGSSAGGSVTAAPVREQNISSIPANNPGSQQVSGQPNVSGPAAHVQPTAPAQPVVPVQPNATATGSWGAKSNISGTANEAQKSNVESDNKKGSNFGDINPVNNIMAGLGGAFDDEENKKKKKKEKLVKEKSGGQLFGGLFGGKSKNTAEPQNNPVMAHETVNNSAKSNVGVAANKPANISPMNNMVQMGVGQNMGLGDDRTIILESDSGNPDRLYLSLYEGAIGYNCPQLIEINLVDGIATIGRADKNGMAQTTYSFDASLIFISRMHARIEKVNDGWQIIDLDSKGGTFLNGQKLVPNMAYPLMPGDILTFTSKHLSYRVSQS